MWKARGNDVQVLVVDVKESKETAAGWAQKMKFTFPVLVDEAGSVSTSYAPAEALPEMPRYEVAIASNLIIDKAGKIQFFELLDSRNFDSKLLRLTARLDKVMARDKKAAGGGGKK
jgi:peroxiredoxin